MEFSRLGNVWWQISRGAGSRMFRAIGFLPHLQLSSTWAFPGPVDSSLDCWHSDSIQNSANQHNLYICSLRLLDSLHSMASNCPLQVQSLFIWGFQGSLDESSFPQLAGRNLRTSSPPPSPQPVRYLAQQNPPEGQTETLGEEGDWQAPETY